MKKLLVFLLAAVFVFSAYGGGGRDRGTQSVKELKYVYAAEIPSLNYYTQGSAVTYEAIATMIDGLVEFNKFGVLIPAVASRWENSADGKVWTFHLRNDVTWVDHNGAKVANVTAHDFVSAAKYVLDQVNASYYEDFYTDYFVNASEYYASTAAGYTGPRVAFDSVGVKAINDTTLQYTLKEPVPYFMSMMNWVPFYPVYGPFLDKVGNEYGISNDKLLYCGAMRLETWRPQNERVYVKNTSYYLANEIHIDKITETYNAEAGVLAPELFRRGEISAASIPPAILDEWLRNPSLAQNIRPSVASWYSYFYAFNFDPQFPAEYEPDNWKIAVNNRNFRKAIFHALNRVAAISTSDPHNPQNHLIKTVTPPNFCDVGGLDYTQVGALARISNQLPTYDVALAERHRNSARTELQAAGAKFPIKVLMPYNSSSTTWAERSQVVKQNLERVLGADFVEIIIYDAPPTNFLGDNRRNGRFALLECNWGPDYSDPETFTDPFFPVGTYNKPSLATGYTSPRTHGDLVRTAKANKTNTLSRYELFAEAEAFLIDEAFIIPFFRSVPGWVANFINPFDANFSSGSMSYSKLNNVRILDKPMNTAEFNVALQQWNTERAAALKAAAR